MLGYRWASVPEEMVFASFAARSPVVSGGHGFSHAVGGAESTRL